MGAPPAGAETAEHAAALKQRSYEQRPGPLRGRTGRQALALMQTLNVLLDRTDARNTHDGPAAGGHHILASLANVGARQRFLSQSTENCRVLSIGSRLGPKQWRWEDVAPGARLVLHIATRRE